MKATRAALTTPVPRSASYFGLPQAAATAAVSTGTSALQAHAASTASHLHDSPVLASLASALVARLRFASQHGLSFDGRRDLYQSLGWPRTVSYADYEALYRRGGIAKRATEIWPRDTWSYGAQVVEDPNPDVETAFEADIFELATRLDLWSVMYRADVLRALGEYSVVLIGAPGELQTPITRLNALSNIAYLKPFGQSDVDIADSDLVQDSTSERYGQPELYSIKLRTGKNATSSRKVHWSRVLHVVEGQLSADLYGAPTLEASYNDLLCLTLIIGGGSEAFWRNVFGGKTIFDLDPNVKFRSTAEEDDFEDQIEELYHDARDYIQTRGVTPKRITHSLYHFGGDVETILRLVAGTLGIPWRRFIGNELGLRSADSDEKAYYGNVALRRRLFAEPLVRKLFDRFITYGAVQAPDSYEFMWPEAEELDEQAKAQMAGSIANANKTQVEAGDTPVMTSAEIRATVFDLAPIADTDFGDGNADGDVDSNVDGAIDGNADDTPRAQSSFRALFDTTDRSADEPEWRIIHRVADANRSALQSYFYDALLSARDVLDVTALRKDAESGNRLLLQSTVALAVDEIELYLRDTSYSRLLSIATDAGLAALRSARVRGGLLRANTAALHLVSNAEFSLTFNAQSPRTIAWARTASSGLVTEISAQTRAALRNLLSISFLEGIPPRRLAAIVRLSVGLRSDQIRALQSYIATLPSTLTEQQLLSRIERRTNKLLRQRALLIARTETINAANAGQRELWLQARDAGRLPRDQKRVWILTPDSRNEDCPICPPMSGQVRGLEEQFETGIGTLIDNPTAHPNCRCGVGLATREDLARAERNAA